MQYGGRIFLRFVFGVSFFLSAFLLFLLQPISGKALLPAWGGAPSVWSMCLLFFQAALFVGYAWAHLIASRLSAKAQVFAHLAAVGAALLMLPIRTDVAPGLASDLPPAAGILLFLLRSVGPAFLALSATAPLLQSWYARCSEESPYRFYALSNAGSFAALIGYPLLVEPNSSISDQARLWSAGFLAFGCALVGAAYLFERSALKERTSVPDRASGRVGWRAVLRWTALAAVPSGLLVAVTANITLDVAAVPFLWVVPLALYLATFILAFASESFCRSNAILPFWILATAGAAFSLLAGGSAPFGFRLGAALATLGAGALLCHGALAGERPDTAKLTPYYMCLTGGGALGGLFAALAAPLVFNDYYELPCLILGVYLLLPLILKRNRWLWPGLAFGAMAMAAVLWAQSSGPRGDERIVDRTRGFFGVTRVVRKERETILTLGDIQHGVQLLSPATRDLPVSYFGPESGAGLAFSRRADKPLSIAVIGLGVGTLAAYGRPNDEIVFFEIDPNVALMAKRHFTYLGSSKAKVSIEIGDGRILLGRQKRRFDIAVVDAFSSNAIPVHLLTEEAFAVYLSKLDSGGILLVNVTNRYLDVARAAQGGAEALGLAFELVETPSKPEQGLAKARWALMARRHEILDAVLKGVETRRPKGAPVLWTDKHSALWTLLK